MPVDAHPHSFPASPRTKTRRRIGKTGNLCGGRATGALGGAGLEAVLEALVDGAQGAAAAGAGGLAALGLLTPVDCCKEKNLVSRIVSLNCHFRMVHVQRTPYSKSHRDASKDGG